MMTSSNANCLEGKKKKPYTGASVYAPQNILGSVIPILQINNSLALRAKRANR